MSHQFNSVTVYIYLTHIFKVVCAVLKHAILHSLFWCMTEKNCAREKQFYSLKEHSGSVDY